MSNLTQHLTTRNAIALLAGVVLIQPFITKTLNTPAYPSVWEAHRACQAWRGNNPKRDCDDLLSDHASRPHVAGTEGDRFVKHFYF